MPPDARIWILAASTSRQTTSFPDSAKQVPVTSPTYPVPTTAIFMAAAKLARAPSGRDHEPGRGVGAAHVPQARGIARRLHHALHRGALDGAELGPDRGGPVGDLGKERRREQRRAVERAGEPERRRPGAEVPRVELAREELADVDVRDEGGEQPEERLL